MTYTDKKNQHYIPKFYLRNFSFKGNKKQIGVHNHITDFIFSTSKLKTQGSKKFYYGKDGKLEDFLSEIEGELANTIKQIIKNQVLPKSNSTDHLNLLHFIALTHLRNPVSINHIPTAMSHIKKQLNKLDPNDNTDNLVPNLSHEEVIDMQFSTISILIENMLDLDFKLLINKTTNPFITSDYPIVKYNQFLEQKKWGHGKTGYATVGLQILIPLSDTLCLIFYDSAIYKVGNKKDSRLLINNDYNIDSINILQFTNCFETVFFSDKASIQYIKKLKSLSNKYLRSHTVSSKTNPLSENGKTTDKDLIIIETTDNETNLNVEGIKIHSLGKQKKLTNSAAQIRKWPMLLISRGKH